MKTVKVAAVKQHIYAQLSRKAGETYDIEERHLKLFERMGRVVKMEIPDPDQGPPSEPLPKRKYNRRDMRPIE